MPLDKPFNLPTPISVCETLITTLLSHVVAKYAKHLIFQEGYELICGWVLDSLGHA